ncbi:MAG: hypothetical protein JWR07_4123, partial [Nevskia sp.]|nr:hypothetical protein [Nevskia sp.]
MNAYTLSRVLGGALAIVALTTAFTPAASYAAAGDPLGPDFRVDSAAGTGVMAPSVARDGIGDIVVVWERSGSANPGIYARLYGADGTPKAAEFKTPLADGYPVVAMDVAGDFVVTTSSYDTAGKKYRIQAQRYAASGLSRGSVIDVATYLKLGEFIANIPAPVAMDADGNFT